METRLGRSGGTFVSDKPIQPKRLSEEIIASHRDIRASYEFRLAVEPAAASMAAQRATPEDVARITAIADEQAWSFRSWRSIDSRFHAAVAEASGNWLLLDAVQRTRTAFFAWYDSIYSRLPWGSLPVQDRDFAFFHRPIAEAIADGDPERAGLLMKEALEWSEQDLEDLLDGVVADASARRGSVSAGRGARPGRSGAPGSAGRWILCPRRRRVRPRRQPTSGSAFVCVWRRPWICPAAGDQPAANCRPPISTHWPRPWALAASYTW